MVDSRVERRKQTSSITILAETSDSLVPAPKRARQLADILAAGDHMHVLEARDNSHRVDSCVQAWAAVCEPAGNQQNGQSCGYVLKRHSDEQDPLADLKRVCILGAEGNHGVNFSPYMGINSMLHRLHDESVQRRVCSADLREKLQSVIVQTRAL
eukprot:TRINITY_DN110334_c0_g1_i1.p1 TRINITY_DN110334_c0_g1~~TRINITY_DN110334_c0_g1_i1.p1  ORF type:complete len:155 (-),score=21.28 TRINITY_DN110334_c0_g1_i1:233-697(-)